MLELLAAYVGRLYADSACRSRRRPERRRPPPGKPRPLGRGHQPRAAHPGHRDQGVRGHAHQPLGLARRAGPAGGRPGHRHPGRRAGPAGRPAALRDQRGRRDRRRPGRPVRPGRGAARRRSRSCRPTCAAGSCSDNLPAELPKAYGERDSIATILTELATNAEKYSPADTPVELCAGADERHAALPGLRPGHRHPARARRAGLRAVLAGRARRPAPPPGRRAGPLPGAPAGRAAAGLGVAAPARGRRHDGRGRASAAPDRSRHVRSGVPVRRAPPRLSRREQASEPHARPHPSARRCATSSSPGRSRAWPTSRSGSRCASWSRPPRRR